MHIPNRTALLLATLALALVAGCERIPPDAVAVVDDKPIKRYTFDAYVARHSQQEVSAEQRGQLLDQAINVQVLAQEALRQKLDHEPAVAGDIEVMRMMRLANAVLRQHMTANPVTEEALRAEYERRTVKVRETEYRARHVLVPSEAEARDVIKQLDRGTKFDRLARTRSTDPGSAKEGGDLGWFTAGTMVAPFSEAVVALPKGKYTKAPVQTQFGWHVILKEDERTREPPPFESVREQLEGSLQEKVAEAYINGLREKAKVRKRETVAEAAAPATAPAAASPATAPAAPAGG
jgi:peptidyl-prolyl cis-trans isomerase C